MLTVSVQSNVREQLDRLSKARRELKEKAIVRALNRTVDNVRAAAVRKIRETYTLKAGTVRQQMSVEKAWGGRLSASVVANGRPIPLYEFAARWSPRMPGASFAVKRGQRKTLKNTFVATMQSGHTGVYERQGKQRLPIDEKYSVGIPGMFGAKEMTKALSSVGVERFQINLAQQIRFLFPN